MAIDTGKPVHVIQAVWIHMVHAFRIPTSARGLKHRTFWYFALGIACRCQGGDLEGTELLTIKWGIVLSVTYKTITQYRHPSTRTGAMRVCLNEWILGMRAPRPEKRISIVEA